MPETRLKKEADQSGNDSNNDRDQQISALLATTVERIRSAMSASGVVIAVRDQDGACCLASNGEAPVVGSRLQSDSAFTRECFETGEVVLCEDAENDSRILPSVAQSLRLRSAVAVPIHMQGSVVGVIEVFSSRPSDISPPDVDVLQECANLVAPIIAPRPMPSAQPVREASAAPSQAPTSAGEEQPRDLPSVSSNWFLREPRRSREQPVDSLRPPVERAPAADPESISNSALSTEGSTAGQISRSRAASLSFLAVVFFLLSVFLFGATQPMTIATSARSPAPHASGSAKRDAPAASKLEEAAAQGTVKPRGRNRSDHSLSAASLRASQGEEEQPAMAVSRETHGVHSEQDPGVASDISSQPAHDSTGVSQNSKSTEVLSKDSGRLSSTAIGAEVPKLETFDLRAEPVSIAMLTATALVKPSAIRSASASIPDFVLDRTLKGHSGWVTGVAFSSDGRRLASGSWDQTVKFWDVPTGEELNTVGRKIKEVQALAFSRDGRWLAAENSKDIVTLWDATTGREIRTFASDRALGVLGSNWVYSIAFSPDGRWLASGVDDKTVRLWDVTTGRALRDLTSLRRSVIYAAFSPDGRWLASGNDDKSIRIWDVATGQEIRRLSGHKKPIYAVAFSPNGYWLASASADKSIKLWDIATGREVRTLTGHGNLVTSLAFSPDGRWLASGSWDKTVKIWDVETGNEVQTLANARNHSVYSVAFDSHGRWLASGSEDGSINLWRLSRGVDKTNLQ
jgi:WD40 repeat protein